ncbi:pentatricopeptide repeat-containing protein At4g39952, mitochondrial-like [Salvia splendens]|uniref:pentatricopeptide repeat-containing protein At4g39952, mitochondrial-like n=1 Tax=Salvia splendens TaxID=180675 RepID=UPI001C27AE8C|nr:pentatricopeptide repeat-containing protein At4g39952, mitochondrial-like [Salvia splendens]XP_042064821.1 pentatricopeptide repeat-containing protein At4g39952, mitochondrial-like [Salvia splendens]XP_042064822.1 pentatricopeptide repeat-containing protein At4g39952, mitochondrial-like [Salvia splendens]XP_042064823.1 pentatricopeptide repeat-containing protein At4g39952, mitochondrial-like [Salvia splendens]
MFVFTLPKLHKHLHSSNSIVDSLSSYLTKHIDSFLTTDYLDQKTLLSAHAAIITTGNAHNKFIASKLIAYYASLKQSHNSTKVFDSLTFTDHFLWNSIIKAHFSNGDHVQAINFFSKMRFAGILPTQFTIPMVVSACAELQSLSIGMKFHGLISKLNLFDGNSAVGASFVYMYSKCGTMDYASLMFDETTVKDVVVWTALVIGHVQNGESEKGFHCLCEMHRTGGNSEKLNFRTLEGGFQACGNLCALVEGRCLHVLALKSGIVSSNVVQSAILSMYSKCGSVEDARMSFSEVVDKDLLSWTSVMGVFSRLGCIVECFDIFLRMQATGLHPDGMAISCLVSGFANSLRVSEGKALHSFIIRRNYMIDEKVHISLLSMYCKFGLVDLAEKIFIQCRDQVKDSWSLMVSSYEKVGLDKKCIMLFGQMQHQGIKPDISSLLSVISSCSRLGAICFARSIHCCMMKTMMLEKVTIVNSLINMYGKCSKLNEAERLLNHTSHDITTWNSLISSYIDNGNCLKAIALFDVMITRGLKPNKATLAVLLSACAQIASLEKGKKVHDYIIEAGFGCEVSVATSLVDMYAKCGQIDMAKEIFNSLSDRDIICWNVMIFCYGMHGYGKSAVEMFQRMKESDVRPNDLTFLAVLSACVHAGLVDEGKSIFHKMKEYSIAPTLKHYACMVDLYGRSGYLDEAEALVLSMPFTPDGGIWGSLLNSCKLHNNVAMGMKIANHAIEADPENDGYYILVSDFYGSMGMWEDVGQVRKKMKDRGVRKTVGWSAA